MRLQEPRIATARSLQQPGWEAKPCISVVIKNCRILANHNHNLSPIDLSPSLNLPLSFSLYLSFSVSHSLSRVLFIFFYVSSKSNSLLPVSSFSLIHLSWFVSIIFLSHYSDFLTHLAALLEDVAVALVVVAGGAWLAVHVGHVQGRDVQLE